MRLQCSGSVCANSACPPIGPRALSNAKLGFRYILNGALPTTSRIRYRFVDVEGTMERLSPSQFASIRGAGPQPIVFCHVELVIGRPQGLRQALVLCTLTKTVTSPITSCLSSIGRVQNNAKKNLKRLFETLALSPISGSENVIAGPYRTVNSYGNPPIFPPEIWRNTKKIAKTSLKTAFFSGP